MSERGPYAKGRERREAILGATLESFSQSGYRGTSLRSIARELGIAPSLIQHYFASREELLTEVIKAWDAQNAELEGDLPMIDAFLLGILHNMSIPGLVRLYTAYSVEASDPEHPARQFFERRYAEMTQSFITDLRQRQADGTAAPDLDPEETARTLIATCEGLQIRWLHKPDFDMHDVFWRFVGSLGIEPYASSEPSRSSSHETLLPKGRSLDRAS